ncbi:MAG TPA: hypothetical protein VF647_00165 [Longimicrobium sp.]|jgi:hypothetical protein
MAATQDCTVDENTNRCVFDPLVVTAPPREDPDPCEESPLGCLTKRPGGESDWWNDGSGSWGSGTGGGEEAPFVPTEEETDGNCPYCGEKQPLAKQDSAMREAIGRVKCESMKSVLQERLPYIQVFTQQPAHLQGTDQADLGYHANGVIYIYEGLFKNDADGNPTVVRDWNQFVQVLVHEAAHAYWSYYQQYSSGTGTHHERWKATMAECGY